MKHILLFETYFWDDDRYDDGDKNRTIEIFTGTNSSNKERNNESFEKLNDLLLSEKNPYYDLFNQENLYLDDTDGFIGIIDNAEEEDFDYVDMMKLNNFIRDHLKNDVNVVIGTYYFEKYFSEEDIKKYKMDIVKNKYKI